jgi:FMN phosphatase YigB (HAD superfamily)
MRGWLAPTQDLELPKAAIFDLDGTLLDSVDLHAIAWQEAMLEFGHDVSFEQARSQIGKRGSQAESLADDLNPCCPSHHPGDPRSSDRPGS